MNGRPYWIQRLILRMKNGVWIMKRNKVTVDEMPTKCGMSNA